ncbi:Cilia- and flagella-associated protein 100 [Collichthys lucidus]|uniref:Cilia-and flagella-associated protein 100 n=1 Tax=Collichthys lucidus TaxID=240159 RepID=A0A4U5UDV6_COLLU|nr:Cilia- and flagella-associated protein 100 [Collichthys lucidus]
MERQKAVLELSLMTKRSEIMRMDKAIAKEEAQLGQLGKIIERDNLKFEESLRENEKKSVEARTFFEQEARSKQEKTIEIKKLTAEIVTIKGEMERFEETLIDYKRYKDLLFKLSPPEWQEAQRTKALKVKISTTQDLNSRFEFYFSVCNPQCFYLTPPCLSLLQDEPELYFTNPQQLLDLVTELTEQNLSLIQNSTRVEETLEELQQSLEIARKKIQKDEEQMTLQINDMKQRIDKEKSRGTKLKLMVQLHISLNTEDQDVMLDALGEKVAEVHGSCVDERMTNLNTVEKLANIENHMSSLLESLDGIPRESLELMKKIKDSEKRTRQREEKLVEQREKQKERMRRYLERSLADSKKVNVRKLMPRCMPVAQKVKVSHVDSTPAEDEFYASLYTYDDVE